MMHWLVNPIQERRSLLLCNIIQSAELRQGHRSRAIFSEVKDKYYFLQYPVNTSYYTHFLDFPAWYN